MFQIDSKQLKHLTFSPFFKGKRTDTTKPKVTLSDYQIEWYPNQTTLSQRQQSFLNATVIGWKGYAYFGINILQEFEHLIHTQGQRNFTGLAQGFKEVLTSGGLALFEKGFIGYWVNGIKKGLSYSFISSHMNHLKQVKTGAPIPVKELLDLMVELGYLSESKTSGSALSTNKESYYSLTSRAKRVLREKQPY